MCLKSYSIKILVKNLSKHRNSFYKVSQENNNPSYTDANDQNDQPFVSPKESIKVNNKNTNCSIHVARNNFVSQTTINNNIRSGQVRFRNFPGATLGELLHYMDLTLAERNEDTAIVHVGKNYINNDDSSTKVENLVLSWKKIAIKLKEYGIKNVCPSGLVFTTRVFFYLYYIR